MFKFVNEPELTEYIGFAVDEEWYCVNIRNVQEIILIPPMSKIPNVPDYIEGAINLRGKIVQVVNMRKWFQLKWKSFTKKSRIIVLTVEDDLVGILVDEVDEVFRVEDFVQHGIPASVARKLRVDYLSSVILQDERILLEVNPKQIYSKEVSA